MPDPKKLISHLKFNALGHDTKPISLGSYRRSMSLGSRRKTPSIESWSMLNPKELGLDVGSIMLGSWRRIHWHLVQGMTQANLVWPKTHYFWIWMLDLLFLDSDAGPIIVGSWNRTRYHEVLTPDPLALELGSIQTNWVLTCYCKTQTIWVSASFTPKPFEWGVSFRP